MILHIIHVSVVVSSMSCSHMYEKSSSTPAQSYVLSKTLPVSHGVKWCMRKETIYLANILKSILPYRRLRASSVPQIDRADDERD